ncbi:MAG: pilus assembly protein PilP [Alphaproteobacteria bacterium]|nr:pilus assembly protein PilP [Alphaproteobacteria bacterium]
MALGLSLLVGCEPGGEVRRAGEDPSAQAAKAKAKAKADAEALAEVDEEAEEEVEPEYAYNPIGKRDPFRSFFRTVESTGVGPAPTPLQRFDIDQYRLVGIVWGIDDARAMVQDPEHTGHVIEIGTYIGKNWGKVTQITASAVIVTEEYQTLDGELVTNQITMSLPVEELER